MALYPDLERKVVLLTGGANGIGEATVRLLARHGAHVHFCDRDAKAGEILSGSLPASSFTKVDLADEQQIVGWVKSVIEKEKRIDVLINNAAIDPRITLESTTTGKFNELLSVNLLPCCVTAREAVAHMEPGSSIINLGSITFHTAPKEMSGYVATKAAILGYSRSLARELGGRGIRVNTVSPGWIMTERQLREFVDEETKQLIRRSQCVPDLLQPEEIAEVVCFLASDCSRAITGQEILADRGWAHS